MANASQEWLDEYLRKGGRIVADNRASVPPPNVEPRTSPEPVAKKEAPRLDSQGRVALRFVGYRHRLCDADGQSGKAVLDAIVREGFLQDDGPNSVERVEFTQTKISKDEEEKTVIEIRKA